MAKVVRDGLLGLYLLEALSEMTDIFLEFDPPKEKYDEFEKHKRIAKLALNLIEDGEDEFDWAVLAKNGELCKRDFDYFAKPLKEAGIESYEKYSSDYRANG